MAESAHRYVRGSTVQFYEWLESSSGRGVPEGPSIWICGDCHVGNIGPIAHANGDIEIQIRDLDQTVIGNPAHDLIRLGLSLSSAARGSDLPGVTTARMIEEMVEGYEAAFEPAFDASEGARGRPDGVQIVMKEAARRSWRHLARERIEDVSPTIPLGKKFWMISDRERAEIDRIFTSESIRQLVTSLKSRRDEAEVTICDAAYWVKGCSSLGRLRYAVLMRAAERGAKQALSIMDVKEATKAAAPHAPGAAMPQDDGERVVTGARHLSPFLGDRMRAADMLGRQVFIRELLPQDLKIEMETLTRDDALRAARFLATVVGRAHSRQMDEVTRARWMNELARRRTGQLDAPSWLWSAVVDLLGLHERAYLEHCRRYALSLA